MITFTCSSTFAFGQGPVVGRSRPGDRHEAGNGPAFRRVNLRRRNISTDAIPHSRKPFVPRTSASNFGHRPAHTGGTISNPPTWGMQDRGQRGVAVPGSRTELVAG